MCMRKLIEYFFRAGALLLTLQSAWGFALSGPIGNNDDAWQVITIGYGYNDPVAPKDFREGYRPVVPVMYYSSDQSFANYYGASGLTNIDSAFGILNGVMCGLTNTSVFLASPTNGTTLAANGQPGGAALTLGPANTLDSYSAGLSEFPLETRQVNYTAQALGLWDMKSTVLHAAVLQLGLADPDRYVWTLHDRLPNPLGLNNPQCPGDVEYLVVQRNYDVNPNTNYPYSSFINGSLYTFLIDENCGQNANVPWSAMTFPYPADPFGSQFSAVARGGLLEGGFTQTGWFFTGLTRDDAAGLKYLLSSNAINWEATAPSGGVILNTNLGSPSPLVTTSNLYPLLVAAQTNSPTALSGLFPGVVVASTVTNWITVTNWNIGSYLTNPPGSPYGSQILVVYSNIVGTAYQPVYQSTFANVITKGNLASFPGIILNGTNVVLNYSSNTVVTLQTVQLTNQIGAPYGSQPFTNITYQTIVLTNQPSGEYFVLPPSQCGWNILNNSPTWSVVAVTNLITQATNVAGFVGSESIVYYFTNHTYLAQAINCSQSTPTPALRRGIGRVQFIRADYDSLTGIYWAPKTNYYSMIVRTNNQDVVEYYQRVVTKPDFLFQAADLTVPTAAHPYGVDYTITTPTFDQSAIVTQLAGPGTVVPGTTLVFNKNLNLYLNGSLNEYGLSTNQFLTQDNQYQIATWGAYDASTNYPVVYPSSASLTSLMSQMLIQVTPAAVPDGTNAVAYNGGSGVTFSATGGQSPYTWAAPNISTLVPGLNFNAATATLSGTPTAPGIYSFSLLLTDSANQVVNFNYSITIH